MDTKTATAAKEAVVVVEPKPLDSKNYDGLLKKIQAEKHIPFELIFPVDKADKSTLGRLLELTRLRKIMTSSEFDMDAITKYISLLFGLIDSTRIINSESASATKPLIVQTHVEPRYALTDKLHTNSIVGELGFRLHQLGEIIYWNGVFHLNILLPTTLRISSVRLANKCSDSNMLDPSMERDKIIRYSLMYSAFCDSYTNQKPLGREIAHEWVKSYMNKVEVSRQMRVMAQMTRPQNILAMRDLCGAIHDTIIEVDTIQKGRDHAIQHNEQGYVFTASMVYTLANAYRCAFNAWSVLERLDTGSESDAEERYARDKLCVGSVLQVIKAVKHYVAAMIYKQEERCLKTAYALLKDVPLDWWEPERKELFKESSMIGFSSSASLLSSSSSSASKEKETETLTDEEKEAIEQFNAEYGENKNTRRRPVPGSYCLFQNREYEWPAFILVAIEDSRTQGKTLADLKKAVASRVSATAAAAADK